MFTRMLKPKTKFTNYNNKINGHFAVPEKAMGKGGKVWLLTKVIS